MTNSVVSKRDAQARSGVPLFGWLQPQPADALLGISAAFRRDARPHKLDLGLGVYRDESGVTPVFKAIKWAEERLTRLQQSKSYIGPEGDQVFLKLLIPLIFGDAIENSRISGVQTPGGTGALRLAGELVARANPDARMLIGTPSWPNHYPLMAGSRLEIVSYPYFDPSSQTIFFEEMLSAVRQARPGDAMLLHACCHNPTGADLTALQWQHLAELLNERQVIPLVDMAYHGLGNGLTEDAAPFQMLAARCPQVLLAYSCDKNFGVYRDRVGALFAIADSSEQTIMVLSNLLTLTRANWSMPPDHGAACVRLILESPEMTSVWRDELDTMRRRIQGIRQQLAAASPRLAALADQKGIFSQLPLSKTDIAILRENEGIYMADSGRINLAGLNAKSVGPLGKAVRPLLS